MSKKLWLCLACFEPQEKTEEEFEQSTLCDMCGANDLYSEEEVRKAIKGEE